MTRKFQTINQVRKFLADNNCQYRGIYGHVYTLANGSRVKFIDRSTKNTWHISNEATEMVEAGE